MATEYFSTADEDDIHERKAKRGLSFCSFPRAQRSQVTVHTKEKNNKVAEKATTASIPETEQSLYMFVNFLSY